MRSRDKRRLAALIIYTTGGIDALRNDLKDLYKIDKDRIDLIIEKIKKRNNILKEVQEETRD